MAGDDVVRFNINANTTPHTELAVARDNLPLEIDI